MSFIVKAEIANSKYIPAPTGMHLARCYRIIDLGTQKTEYMGNVKHLPKVMFQFEIHSEDDQGNPTVTSDGKPMNISKKFTVSLADKATLRRDLQTWRGQEFTAEELNGFDIKKVLGAWCMLSIIRTNGNDGKEYTNIAAIMPVPPAIKKAGLPKEHNPLGIFTIENPDMALYESFSEGLKNTISLSPEWQAKKGKQSNSANESLADMEDDVPF